MSIYRPEDKVNLERMRRERLERARETDAKGLPASRMVEEIKQMLAK